MADTGTVTQDAGGVVQWQIEGFTSLEMNEMYWSPPFSCDGREWYLGIRRVYPEGGWSGQRIELELYRYYVHGPPTLDVEWTFSIKDRDGHRHGERRSRKKFVRGAYSPFIGIELQEERMSDLVPGDNLTVLCRLALTRGAAQLQEEQQQNTEELASVRRELAEKQSELVRLRRLNEELNLKVTDLEADRDNAQKLLQTKSGSATSDCSYCGGHFDAGSIKRKRKCHCRSAQGEDCDSGSSSLLQKNKVLRDLKDLLHKKELCDVVLKVKGQEFPALKAILMVRSPVFASTFQSDIKEKMTGVIQIEDCDPSSFSDFLCYLYCGVVENLSPENVFSLFTTADKYDIQDLRSECLAFVKENLSVDTFCDTMTLALRHSETELIELCTDFFIKNATRIITTAEWQTFVVENPIHGNELFVKFATSVGRSNE